MLKKIISVIVFTVCCCFQISAVAAPNPVWQELQDKYLKTDSVNQLIFVKYLGGSTAYLELYLKDVKEQKWDMVLRCDALVGKNGLGKSKEGDKKTPLGDYGVTMAMGFLPDPGTKMEYMLMDEHTFTTGDKRYYNRVLDDREVIGIAREDDYLTTIGSSFNYCLFIDYNKDCIWKRGSCIWLHCRNKFADSSHGCISVWQRNMVEILKAVDSGVRICIYPE